MRSSSVGNKGAGECWAIARVDCRSKRRPVCRAQQRSCRRRIILAIPLRVAAGEAQHRTHAPVDLCIPRRESVPHAPYILPTIQSNTIEPCRHLSIYSFIIRNLNSTSTHTSAANAATEEDTDHVKTSKLSPFHFLIAILFLRLFLGRCHNIQNIHASKRRRLL